MVSVSRMLISAVNKIVPGRSAGSNVIVSGPGLALALPIMFLRLPRAELVRLVTMKLAGAMRDSRSSGAYRLRRGGWLFIGNVFPFFGLITPRTATVVSVDFLDELHALAQAISFPCSDSTLNFTDSRSASTQRGSRRK